MRMIPPSVFLLGWCVALGGTTALDTLGSQAYTGGSQKTDLSIHFQRAILILWFLLVPVCVLWYFIESVLLWLGQPPSIARDSQTFLRILIIGAPGYFGFESLKKYLQCQGSRQKSCCKDITLTWPLGIMGASTLILIVVSPINLALNVFLVHFSPLGLFGSPLATSISYWLCFIFLGVWTYCSPIHKRNGTWGGIQIKTVLNPLSCYQFLKLALPGILMVGTEWFDIFFSSVQAHL